MVGELWCCGLLGGVLLDRDKSLMDLGYGLCTSIRTYSKHPLVRCTKILVVSDPEVSKWGNR